MTTPAKIEPWMRVAATEIDYYYWKGIGIEEFAATIAAHAPQEPPEWEAKEKALRELLEDAELHAVDCVPEEYTLRRLEQKYLKGDNYSAGQYELAKDAIAILNREQEKP